MEDTEKDEALAEELTERTEAARRAREEGEKPAEDLGATGISDSPEREFNSSFCSLAGIFAAPKLTRGE